MKYIAITFCAAALIFSDAQAQQQPMSDLNKMFKEHNNAPKTPSSQQDIKKMFEGITNNAAAQKAAAGKPVDTTPCKGLVAALQACKPFSCTVKNRLGSFTKTSVVGSAGDDSCKVNTDISDGKFMHCTHGPDRMKALINVTKRWMQTGMDDMYSKDAKIVAGAGVDGSCQNNLVPNGKK